MAEYYCYNCDKWFDHLTSKKECPECKDKNINEYSECCGVQIGDDRICPDCKEHC